MADVDHDQYRVDMHTVNGNDSVCRDFLRNVCRRGKNCKYRHPEDVDPEEIGQRAADLVFCHDYQNQECFRPNCRFLHCTYQEEQVYRATGKLPGHVLADIAAGRGFPPGSTTIPGLPPVCKDFLKGDCKRAGRCRFRHLTPSEYEAELQSKTYDRMSNYENQEPEPKRRALEEHVALIAIPPGYRLIEQENAVLRRRVEELKKQVADLMATNEFLLDQNAQLRISKQTTVSQVARPLSVIPAAAALQPSITPLAVNNTELTAAQTTLAPQRLAPELAGATPQSIAPIVPVSIAPVSMATALPAVSLSQSLAQSIITMSSTSTPLVSYPIMTQSLRPVIAQRLGH